MRKLILWIGLPVLTVTALCFFYRDRSDDESSILAGGRMPAGTDEGYTEIHFTREVTLRKNSNEESQQKSGVLFVEEDASKVMRFRVQFDGESKPRDLEWVQDENQRYFLGQDTEIANELLDLAQEYQIEKNEDAMGEYTVSTTKRGEKDRIIQKQKVSYVKRPEVQMIRSEHRRTHAAYPRVDGALWVQVGRDELQIHFGNGLSLEADLAYRMSNHGKKRVFSAISGPKTLLSQIDSKRKWLQAQNEKGSLFQVKMKDWVANPKARKKNFRRILKQFELDPQGSFSAWQQEANEFQSDIDFKKMSVSAFSNTSCEPCDGKLRDWIREIHKEESDDVSWLNQMSLGNRIWSDEIRVELKTAVERLGDSRLREPLLLAYGSLLDQSSDPLPSQNSAEKKQSLSEIDSHIQFLKSAYQTASGKDKSLVLEAMSNSGRADFLPEIRDALQSADVDLRSKAVMGLRLIQSPTETIPLYRKALSDPEIRVKEASLRSLSFQSHPEVQKVYKDFCEGPTLKDFPDGSAWCQIKAL